MKIFLRTGLSFLACLFAGVPTWITAALGTFCVAFTWFIYQGRGAWGDTVTLQPGVLIIGVGGAERFRIAAASVTGIQIRPDLIGVAWQTEGKKMHLLIGGECFAEATWSELNQAFNTFSDAVPDEKKILKA